MRMGTRLLALASPVLIGLPALAQPSASDSGGRTGTTINIALDSFRTLLKSRPDNVGTTRPELSSSLLRTETIQTIGDTVGDAAWARGDITAAGVGMGASGVTALGVSVLLYESPFSLSWQYGQTGIVWDLDTNGDQVEDFYAAMLNYNGTVSAGLFTSTDVFVCAATPSADASASFYGAAFPSSCLGNPVSVNWWVGMLFQDFSTGIQSSDFAPNIGWSGPVFNDAVTAPPTTPPATVPPVTNPPPSSNGFFTSVGPVRWFDTRVGGAGVTPVSHTKVGGGYVLEVSLANVFSTSGVSAVSMNVTATDPEAPGYLTVYPCGSRAEVSSLNFVRDQTVPNAVITPISSRGTVCFYASVLTNVLVDVNGWLAAGPGFTSVGPVRWFDTRVGGAGVTPVSHTKVGGGYVLEVSLANVFSTSGVSAVSMNVTATDPEAPGYLTVYPCGSRAEVSSLNFVRDQTVPNAVITPISSRGTVCFYASVLTNVLVDVNGWFAA